MRSAEAFVTVFKKGLSADDALSFLPQFELRRRRVYMSFTRLGRIDKYCCRFHSDNLAKTPISKRFVFRRQQIFETASRGHGITSVRLREALAEAVAIGHGGIWLKLTEEQLHSIRSHS